jgi:uncharacterized membrane protein YbhN (UPF0104 family)
MPYFTFFGELCKINEDVRCKKPGKQIIFVKKLLFTVKIAFISALFGWIAWKFDARTARAIVASAQFEWGLIALLIVAAANLFSTMRWERLIRGCCPGRAVPVKNLYWFNLLALFYNIFIPTTIAGEAVRVYKLKSAYGTDYARSTVAVVIDRLLGAFTWFVMFLLMPSPFRGNRNWLWLLLLVPVAVFVFRKRIAVRDRRLLDFTRHHPGDIGVAACYSLVSQILFVATNYAIFRCFGLSMNVLECAGLTATTTLASIVPISLLGVGLKEGSFLAFLPLYGASNMQAMMATSFMVFLNYVFALGGGMIELANTGWNFARLRRGPEGVEPPLQDKA